MRKLSLIITCLLASAAFAQTNNSKDPTWWDKYQYLKANGSDPASGSTTSVSVGTNVDVGNNLIVSRLFFRLNENWAASVSHHFEARDGTMEEQHYTLYRDLRSWTTALTLRYRQNTGGPDDFGVAFTFSLKAFPRFGLGSDTAHATRLLGS